MNDAANTLAVPQKSRDYLGYSIQQIRESGLLTEARLTELMAETERRIECPRDSQGNTIQSGRLATFADGTRYLYAIHDNHSLAYCQREVFESLLTDDEFALLKRRALSECSARYEAQRFAKATKISEREWSGGAFWGDQYYSDLESLYEAIADSMDADDDDKTPVYAWAAKAQQVVWDLNVNDVLERAIEERGWEDMDTDDLRGVPELREAIERFVKANESVVSYEIDYSRAIILDEQRIKNLIRETTS